MVMPSRGVQPLLIGVRGRHSLRSIDSLADHGQDGELDSYDGSYDC